MKPVMAEFDYRHYYDSFLNHYERKNAPRHLFLEGDSSLLTTGIRASVVGSRQASSDGLKRTEIITRALVDYRITVVSGLAEGVDTVAHKTAINHGGKTIAVLGTPLSKAFPASNRDLLAEIKRNHLAISQFSEGTVFHKSHFPMRNKTMALISDATIIVEASENSGTRHQGWEAIRLGRLVFLMENVANDKSLSWPSQMLEYGAQVLKRDSLDYVLSVIPSFTSMPPLEINTI